MNRLTARLLRDGFHALAVLPNGGLVAAVAGAVITLHPNDSEFRVTHAITRGTRPLHITAVPDGTAYWGEYFDNPSREEVRVYASSDGGATWHVAYTFPAGAIRHIHNIVYDRWENCLWVLTGDYGNECRILRASCDFSRVDAVLQGNQQARAVALVITPDGLYFSSDTPLEPNYIYRLDRKGMLSQLASISSSSIYGCAVQTRVFFSTMVEPSQVNLDPNVRIYAGGNSSFQKGLQGRAPIPGETWQPLLAWKKDRWPMRFFQYGNAFLPDGENSTPYLAVSTIAVEADDMTTSIYPINE
jgi:streptogramin lyase